MLALMERPSSADIDINEHEGESESPTAHEEVSRTEELLEQMDYASGSGFNRDILLVALKVISEVPPERSAGYAKRSWVERLSAIPMGSTGINPRTVALVGWVCHMCEVGTIGKRKAAVSTIQKYARQLLLDLGRRMSNWETMPDEWEADDLLEVYRSIFRDSSPGSRTSVIASLLSFHDYLVQSFDIEPLHERIDKAASHRTGAGERKDPEGESGSDGSAKPAALMPNMVWPHEVLWCIEACAAVEDQRMGGIARVMLYIARECAVRYQDLSRLVIGNLTFSTDHLGDYCQIEVVRKAIRGSLKTETSQRRLIVRCVEALRAIQSWIHRRADETPNRKAYLFGDRNSDKKRYRPAAVQALLSRLLKHASGCKNARFHDLRHTVISQEVKTTLMSSAWADVSLLEQVASAAGHASPLTTLRSYSHLYEHALRLHLDIALLEGNEATSAELVQTLIGLDDVALRMQPNSLVQMAKRRKISITEAWWRLVHDAADRMPAIGAAAPFEWETPKPLQAERCTARDMPVEMLADALARKARGESLEAVARIAGLSTSTITRLFDELERWLFGLYRKQFPRRALNLADRPDLTAMMVAMRIRPNDMYKPFWQRFSKYLNTRQGKDQMSPTVSVWERSGPGIHLDLSKSIEPRSMITLLKCAGFGRESLRVVIQAPRDSEDASSAVAHKWVSSLFQQELGVEPAIESVAWRADRPMAYLRMNPHEASEKTGASSDMTPALRAWIVAMKARIILDELEKTGEQ